MVDGRNHLTIFFGDLWRLLRRGQWHRDAGRAQSAWTHRHSPDERPEEFLCRLHQRDRLVLLHIVWAGALAGGAGDDHRRDSRRLWRRWPGAAHGPALCARRSHLHRPGDDAVAAVSPLMKVRRNYLPEMADESNGGTIASSDALRRTLWFLQPIGADDSAG